MRASPDVPQDKIAHQAGPGIAFCAASTVSTTSVCVGEKTLRATSAQKPNSFNPAGNCPRAEGNTPDGRTALYKPSLPGTLASRSGRFLFFHSVLHD